MTLIVIPNESIDIIDAKIVVYDSITNDYSVYKFFLISSINSVYPLLMSI